MIFFCNLSYQDLYWDCGWGWGCRRLCLVPHAHLAGTCENIGHHNAWNAHTWAFMTTIVNVFLVAVGASRAVVNGAGPNVEPHLVKSTQWKHIVCLFCVYCVFMCYIFNFFLLFGAAIFIAGGMDDHPWGEQVVVEDVGVVVKQIGVQGGVGLKGSGEAALVVIVGVKVAGGVLLSCRHFVIV